MTNTTKSLEAITLSQQGVSNKSDQDFYLAVFKDYKQEVMQATGKTSDDIDRLFEKMRSYSPPRSNPIGDNPEYETTQKIACLVIMHPTAKSADVDQAIDLLKMAYFGRNLQNQTFRAKVRSEESPYISPDHASKFAREDYESFKKAYTSHQNAIASEKISSLGDMMTSRRQEKF